MALQPARWATRTRSGWGLTLNPLRHLDLFGSLFCPFDQSVCRHHVRVCKAVPYTPQPHDRRWGAAKVSSQDLDQSCSGGAHRRRHPGGRPALGEVGIVFASYALPHQFALALFNLIPVPAADGHWLLLALRPVDMI